MLRYRLLFGTLMTVFFAGLVILDGWLDGSVTALATDDKPVQGTILAILVAAVLGLATVEFSRLAAAKQFRMLTGVSVVSVIVLSTSWYWPQWLPVAPGLCVPYVVVFALLGCVLAQQLRSGTEGVLGNCGASCLAIIYLGLLGAFVLAIRLEVGLWATLMFMFAVKCSDIGAYTFGKLFGKHKFSPRVSPGKTWEGLGGAMVLGMAVSLAFATAFGIMPWWLALIFGGVFAVVGQMGDLVESMLKRDAQQKDSSNRVPGFGGILDVIDSPLVAAPFAYLFFKLLV